MQADLFFCGSHMAYDRISHDMAQQEKELLQYSLQYYKLCYKEAEVYFYYLKHVSNTTSHFLF